jgi:hypothetical protein
VSILYFSLGLVLPPEELPQICHATNDGTSYGSGTGEENTHKQSGRSCVTRWLCACRQAYGHETKKEPSTSTSERAKQRAAHETPLAYRGTE